jgi:tetratricopeptide (TPR) repeat protein
VSQQGDGEKPAGGHGDEASVRGVGASELSVSTTTPNDASHVRPREIAPASPEASALPRGTTIGRYTILALVGRGGMGEVYAAYDPELDRKVALKLLLSASTTSGAARSRARLLREAKAIAKLQHPNVIVVHDAGTFEDRVFVAMEFVDGQTLKEWVAEAPRTRREILEVFGAAARGLAAAHAAGLVHRDFKPHNVMVGRDGSVRVMDFGLARQMAADAADGDPADGDAPDATAPEAPARGDAPEVDPSLTRTGEVLGTPLYMAPEQFRGERTDARTDQFSFCVALYQALYGVPPFGREAIATFVPRVLAGDVQPPPAKNDVPAWLRRVLLRGLSVEREARWPSMSALLEALARDPERARRGWAATVAVLVLVTASIVTLVRGPRRAESLCRSGPQHLAGVWEPADRAGAPRPRRDALAAAFASAGGTAATAVWPHVEAALDRYAHDWLAMYRDACEATQVRGEQSPVTMDLRMACLDERRGALTAVTSVLEHADAVAVSNALDAVGALPRLERCGDVKGLREAVEPPRDEVTRARIADLRQRLAVAKALYDTGKTREARERGVALIAEARAVSYPPLLAETLSTVGQFSNGNEFSPESLPVLEEAVWTALAAKRDDVAADTSAILAACVGYYLSRPEDGWRWAHLAQALIDRMGPGHDRSRAWLLQDEANIKLVEHDARGALALFQQAVAIKETLVPPDDRDLSISVEAAGDTMHQLGRNEEALRLNERAYELSVRADGPAAADMPLVLSNRGEYLVALGRAAEAIPVFREALAIARANDGRETGWTAYPLTGIGQALLSLARPAEAVEPLEHALRLREANEPNASVVADTRFALARALWDGGGDRRRARALAAQARQAYALLGASPTGATPTTPGTPTTTDDAATSALANPLATVDAWLARHG